MATQTVAPSTAGGTLNGFNVAQVKRILEQIACSADVASTLAACAAQRSSHESAYEFHALQIIIEKMGALAEMVVPGTVNGSPIEWALGDGFADLKEVSHG